MLDGPGSDEARTKSRSGSERRERGMVNTFRSTSAERQQAETDAAAVGLTFGSYVRWLLFERPQTRPVRRPLPAEVLLYQLKAEAGRVDGNLAQLLRMANRGEAVPVNELADAARAVRDFYVYALDRLKGP